MLTLLFNDARVADYVKKQLDPDIDDFGLCSTIGVAQNNQIIAGVVYNNFIGREIHASIASTNPRWANKGILRAIFSYPFLQLGCARITAQTRGGNYKAQKFLTKLGFINEGLLRDWYRDDDALIYGILKQECRWINNIK